MLEKNLVDSRCVPCQAGGESLPPDVIESYQHQLDSAWKVIDNHHLHREYAFKNFRDALEFVNQVAALAETQAHHPDIHLSWGSVKLDLWTHKVDGLHENDFILAAKIDKL